jgi:hypothetical protein
LALITSASAFEFAGPGPGINTETRRNESNKYGRGFCRWLLYKHLKLTYFATINELITRGLPTPYHQWTISKIPGGDSPDYLCADKGTAIALAEAKGRLSPITWTAPSFFPTWRKQFNHVEIRDNANTIKKLKGYIIATQMKCATRSKMQSKIFAEDPVADRGVDLTPEDAGQLHRAIMACHYSDVLGRMGLLVHSAYLRLGATLKERPNRSAMEWKCLIPSLQTRTFVGVVYPPPGAPAFTTIVLDASSSPSIGQVRRYYNPLIADFTFFGLESSLFKAVIEATYSGLASLSRAEELTVPSMPDGTSMLRDGTLLCPLDFMQPGREVDV